MNRQTVSSLGVACLVAAVYLVSQYAPESTLSGSALQDAISAQQSDVQVEGSGTLVKILPDDNEGSRHQRLIVRLENGGTLLLAHNIDLAPRIPDLAVGDRIDFFGEYVWNEKGGIIHWTHHDPAGRHVGGWLKHKGKTYE